MSTKSWSFTLCHESQHKWTTEWSPWLWEKMSYNLISYLISLPLCHPSSTKGWPEIPSESWPLISIQCLPLSRQQEYLFLYHYLCQYPDLILGWHCCLWAFLQHNFLFELQELAFCLLHPSPSTHSSPSGTWPFKSVLLSHWCLTSHDCHSG